MPGVRPNMMSQCLCALVLKVHSRLTLGLRRLSLRANVRQVWSPVRRFNAGWIEVVHPGDYAILNSYRPRDDTVAATGSF
jgi:hypothetical protein